MKVVGYLLGACVILAVVRAVAAALIIGLGLSIVIGVCVRPKETFGLLAFLLIAGLIQHHGLAFLAVVALVLIFGVIKQIAGIHPLDGD